MRLSNNEVQRPSTYDGTLQKLKIPLLLQKYPYLKGTSC